ncbi:transcriptional regulator [Acinetobacter guillouiae]|uniref:transcriptional regulator n=2 Tax=Acinetobacter guillouiae TaxID=106649 RepID=UPI003AF54BD4
MVEEKVVIDFNKFLDSLNNESDRAVPLITAALIEEILHRTLQAFLCDVSASKKILDGFNAPLGTFSSKIDACYALGLIDEHEYNEINLIRKIRNEFAHTVYNADFNIQKVKDLCMTFKYSVPPDIGDKISVRGRFNMAAVALLAKLYYRPEYVITEKRRTKSWKN